MEPRFKESSFPDIGNSLPGFDQVFDPSLICFRSDIGKGITTFSNDTY